MVAKIGLVLLCLFLTGCYEKKDYSYFMEHPDALQKAVENCQVNAALSFCSDANQALRDFSALTRERVDDPELFGQKVMQEQETLVASLQALQQAKKTNDQAKIKSLEEAYLKQEEKVKTLYAVIVATSQGALGRE